MGDSGSGKSTIADFLASHYPNVNVVKSYTTRPRRSVNDNDHIFTKKRHLLYKMFNNKFVASTIIDNELYCAFPEQFDKKKINIYIVDDKGLLDSINYFGKENILAIRLKRNNISVEDARMKRNLNKIVPDGCSNIKVVQNIIPEKTCSEIYKLCSKKWA